MKAWRRVFHPYWWSLGWRSKYQPGESRFVWSLCLSNFNRPIVRWSRDPGCRYVSLEWGNGNSDPAWSVSWEGKREPMEPLTDAEWESFRKALDLDETGASE